MTPAARLSAAIGILDRILDGAAVEPALTNWGRASRFAGSGDRAAVRDLVFDALRCRRSFAALGGAATGRGLILGGVRAAGSDPATLFTGQGHAPEAAGPDEAGRMPTATEALDCPEWLLPQLGESLGADRDQVLGALRSRAPVFLRVNTARISVDAAIGTLLQDGITAVAHPLASTALEVTGNARKIQASAAYMTGLVELQDASSQAVIDMLPLRAGLRVLDLCAGGGGKTLAMAAKAPVQMFAHDADPRRMRDLPARLTRAQAVTTILENPSDAVPYDLILTDVPCSGSGSWRRDPMGKWALTPDALQRLLVLQADILDLAAPMVAPGGTLAYATCSLLADENETQVAAFVARNGGWQVVQDRHFTPLQGGDGFYAALLTRV